MTALTSTLWFLSSPTYIDKLMNRVVKFTMLIQYYGIKEGKTISIKR